MKYNNNEAKTSCMKMVNVEYMYKDSLSSGSLHIPMRERSG